MIFAGAFIAIMIIIGMIYFIQRNKVIAEANRKLDHLNSKLKEQALRDPLTKLHNRRFVTEIHEKIAATVVRRKSSAVDDKQRIGLVLLDIDHFKQINDNYGHDIGDQVLIEVASLLQQVLRKGDIAVRWGGEEFLVILFDTNQQGLNLFCERILSLMNTTPIKMGEGSNLVTLSMGHTLFPFVETDPHGLSWDESLKLIDRLLYIAKEQGRNQAVGISKDPNTTNDGELNKAQKRAILELVADTNPQDLLQAGFVLTSIESQTFNH